MKISPKIVNMQSTNRHGQKNRFMVFFENFFGHYEYGSKILFRFFRFFGPKIGKRNSDAFEKKSEIGEYEQAPTVDGAVQTVILPPQIKFLKFGNEQF